MQRSGTANSLKSLYSRPSSAFLQELLEDNEETDTQPGDSIIPMVGNIVRREKEAIYASVEQKTAVQEELRLLVTAAVVRIARRVYYEYMRQLWDLHHYRDFAAQDQHDEVIHRKV